MIDAALLSAVNQANASRRAIATVTALDDGSTRLVEPGDVVTDPLGGEIENRFRSGKSGIVSDNDQQHFIRVYIPPPLLVIIGAVHISQTLAPMAKACNFDVTVIDPRTAFATEERFRGINLKADWPEESLKEMPLDAYTALAALTHDPKIDDFPLMAALDADCFYVGALGSRKTHEKRCDRLRVQGKTQAQLDRIDAPIGLDIGAANPAEIAVAVLARIIECLRKSRMALEAAA